MNEKLYIRVREALSRQFRGEEEEEEEEEEEKEEEEEEEEEEEVPNRVGRVLGDSLSLYPYLSLSFSFNGRKLDAGLLFSSPFLFGSSPSRPPRRLRRSLPPPGGQRCACQKPGTHTCHPRYSINIAAACQPTTP